MFGVLLCTERNKAVESWNNVTSEAHHLPGFPVAEHFNANGHTLQNAQVRGDMLCGGNKLRKRQEMRLIFKLGTSQPHGLNSDFRYL